MLVLKFASSFDSPLAQGFDRLRVRYLPFVRGDSASAEAAKGLSDRPLETFGFPLIGWYRDQALAGRGGSVSRRGHNQATGNRTHFQAEPTMQKGTSQTPSALRERGSGGEALLSEKRPLPQNLPTAESLREGARGRGLLFREAPSLAYLVII